MLGLLVALKRPPRLVVGSSWAQAVRHAGGGGRPGGRPTLNWKQKQQLRLANKAEKSIKMRSFGGGDFSEIEHLVGKDWMKSSVNLSTVAEYKYDVVKGPKEGDYEGDGNTRKKIQISALFGPSKKYGELDKKYNFERRTFSMKRLHEAKNAKKSITSVR